MKYASFFFLLVFCFPEIGYAQGSDWLWAQSSYTSYPTRFAVTGRKVICDSKGNFFVAGYFYQTDFGLDSIALFNNGGTQPYDTYVAKYNKEGRILWLKQIAGKGNNQSETITGLALDKDENILICGNFDTKTLQIGQNTFTNNYTNNTDIFVAKIHTDGQYIWSKQFGGNSRQTASSIVCSKSGATYICGSFSNSTFLIGSISLKNKNTNNSSDGFLARLNASGDVVWAQVLGGIGNDYLTSISVGNSGTLYLGGTNGSNTIVKDSITISAGTLFVAQTDTMGVFTKAITLGIGYGIQLHCDEAENIYFCGYYSTDTFKVGNLKFPPNPYNTDDEDFFCIKLDNQFNALWGKSGTGKGNYSNNNTIYSVTSDKEGNVYMACNYYCEELKFENIILYNAGSSEFNSNFCILKYNANGDMQYLKNINGDESEMVYSIALNPENDLFLTGTYSSSTLQFGHIALHPSNPGGNEVFISKLSSKASGIESIYPNFDVRLYPNPAKDNLFISADSDFPITEIWIMDAQGRILFRKTYESSQDFDNLDISSLRAGVYYLQLHSGSQLFTKKFIKL